ncbi:6564_t:CDS:10 [Acaulospora morrowiae]|uniref:DnaJ homolog 1, mitochondrial n=1 Tax=Acaulospora morrowiae TaxID=94023 RepID=A0A9N9EWQ4_9GLOM|nr:6564_t:CDS:10 [Acaulospora morrowiae]
MPPIKPSIVRSIISSLGLNCKKSVQNDMFVFPFRENSTNFLSKCRCKEVFTSTRIHKNNFTLFQRGLSPSFCHPNFASRILIVPFGAPASPITHNNQRLFHTSAPRQAKESYYDLLGVPKNASQSDIKKAYYTLAKKYHPDTNKDPSAKEKFVKIQEAYNVLSDEEHRAQYDQWGTDASNFSGAGGFEGFSGGFPDFRNFGGFGNTDFFNHVFGGFTRGPGPGFGDPLVQGSDIEMQLSIPFMDAINGTTQTVTVEAISTCKECKGRGTKGGANPDKCYACNGTGVRRMSIASGFHMQSTCPECDGKGTRIRPENRCTSCAGRGQVRDRRPVAIDIPAGVENGMSIRIPKQGDVPLGVEGIPGDLIVRIRVLPHKIFKRQGSNIIVEAQVPFQTAILGGTIKVPTVDGDVELKVPPGSQPEQQAYMKKRGVRKLNSQSRGDQIVVFKVKLPTSLTPKQKELIEEFAHTEGSSDSKDGFFKNASDKIKGK